MTYTKPIFLVAFLPITIILFNLLPQKHRWKVLLLSSYVFFWSISGKLLIYLLAATAITYGCGRWLNKLQVERDNKLEKLEKEQKKELKQLYIKKQRKIVALCSILLIGMLVVLKYTKFSGSF